MGKYLYWLVEQIAKIHSGLLRLNDAYEYNFTDKELHFLIIGLLGMFMIFLIYPLFKWLAKKGHVMVISWIYVFTLIVVITFAIEIGQRVTNTGVMEFKDIVFGVFGFVCMFLVFSMVRGIWHLIVKGMVRLRQRRAMKQTDTTAADGNGQRQRPREWDGPDRRQNVR